MTTSTREEIRVGPLAIRFLIEGEESGGSVAVFEFDVPAGAKVAAGHSHDGYEETIYGLEGVLAWTIEGVPVDVGEGSPLDLDAHVERVAGEDAEQVGTAETNGLVVTARDGTRADLHPPSSQLVTDGKERFVGFRVSDLHPPQSVGTEPDPEPERRPRIVALFDAHGPGRVP
jgi:quercetin dioxygenase-like cupin family protein